MKHFNLKSLALCALLLPGFCLAASDMFLKIDNVEGESQVVACVNGACVVPPLAIGNYSVFISDAMGTVIPTNITLSYAFISPRDAASGMATGKRMHKPLTLTVQLGRGVAPGNVIRIDEDGTQLAIGINDEAVAAGLAKVTKTRSNIQNN